MEFFRHAPYLSPVHKNVHAKTRLNRRPATIDTAIPLKPGGRGWIDAISPKKTYDLADDGARQGV